MNRYTISDEDRASVAASLRRTEIERATEARAAQKKARKPVGVAAPRSVVVGNKTATLSGPKPSALQAESQGWRDRAAEVGAVSAYDFCQKLGWRLSSFRECGAILPQPWFTTSNGETYYKAADVDKAVQRLKR